MTRTSAWSSMTRLGFPAEDWTADLFRRLGYSVSQNILIAGVQVDLTIERDGVSAPVEVMFYDRLVPLSLIKQKIVRLRPLVELASYDKPIIAVLGKATTQAKEFALDVFGANVWDLEVLRQKSQAHPDLSKRLEKLLGEKQRAVQSSRGNDTTDEPDESLQITVTRQSEADRLIAKLARHKEKGGLTPREYEELCQETVTFLFDPDLYGFEKQAQTSDGGNRYDFICRIRSGNSFWDSIRNDFRTRSVLFECKDYEDLITADQVYSTERYLFSGALRTVCFLLSRKGPDEGCKRAAQGALRESGKLILLLSNDDLVEMLKLAADKEGPTNFLDEKIWQFVVTLPR
ncbi:hypothetical protein AB7M16_007346 [Bradyrhizobium sp. USDA 372]